jgi:hypothetical protein
MLDSPEMHRPSWDVLLIEIANAQGILNHSPYRTPDTKAAFMSDMQHALDLVRGKEGSTSLKMLRTYCTSVQHNVPAPPTDPQASNKAGTYIRKKTPDTTEYRQAMPQPMAPLPPQMHMPPPLRYDWRAMAYTDGSYIAKDRKMPGNQTPWGSSVTLLTRYHQMLHELGQQSTVRDKSFYMQLVFCSYVKKLSDRGDTLYMSMSHSPMHYAQ